ncbi:glycoside hydrolase family 31 protein [Ruegeria sp. 2205SS24-7]|uniref:glycoside hydrolase family 31 protein n=1 Tax=Ruegeria discodermiae TaxID=3064389 RepID=UPI0027407001|nr:glycoside hydrolase family 31 protein [Ruegeria sp. 2205SS24-7]MDP5218990.1 glycoside hydrolase family 31 protein [Ruegeria sp. 2205SS24-7]
MKTLCNWRLDESGPNGLSLRIERRHLLRIEVLDHDLVRVRLLRDGVWRLDRSWSVAPQSDVPWEGRARDDLAGFSCPKILTDDATLETNHLRLTVMSPLALRWECRIEPDAPWRHLAEDRTTGAFMLGRRDNRVAHFMHRFPDERYFGLGEKAGPLERGGRRYEMRNLDALGYDARSTDPLYKHIPFSITERPGAGAMGLFYDNLSTCWFDLGNELDNYHAPFRSWRAEDGDLDLYLSWAPDVRGVVKRQAWLTGGTAFMPRWGLGYSASSMAYTDAPDAQEQMHGFLERLRTVEIPCDSFQMSSGYTSINGKRYVFNWNTAKFPDMAGLAADFAAEDVELIANIKPVMLDDHPKYAKAVEQGLFLNDSETGQSEVSAFWDGQGTHLDFTNPDTVRWWQDNVTTALLTQGIGSTWNDNNEYEVWDDGARAKGFGVPIEISQIRPLMGLLMTRASHGAQLAHAPDKRPYLISRCAAPGTQRYAQTWTGDNRTNWDTLRWNIPMGLGLSLSGFYNIGHDVGGFAGPRPEPELFLRWVQNGIFHPRFTIHSWNDDNTANEPWMYPEITAQVRDAIRLRYRLLPYLYTQLYRAVTEHEPILRPLFLDFPDDPACRDAQFEFMLGPDLLIASVIEQGAKTRQVYLPDWPGGWWQLDSARWHPGGQTLEIPVTLDSIPVFVRGGSVLPLSENTTRATPDKEGSRVLLVCPARGVGGTITSWVYDDDGIAQDALSGNHCLAAVKLTSGDAQPALDWTLSGRYAPGFGQVEIRSIDAQPLLVRGLPSASGQMHPYGGLRGAGK